MYQTRFFLLSLVAILPFLTNPNATYSVDSSVFWGRIETLGSLANNTEDIINDERKLFGLDFGFTLDTAAKMQDITDFLNNHVNILENSVKDISSQAIDGIHNFVFNSIVYELDKNSTLTIKEKSILYEIYRECIIENLGEISSLSESEIADLFQYFKINLPVELGNEITTIFSANLPMYIKAFAGAISHGEGFIGSLDAVRLSAARDLTHAGFGKVGLYAAPIFIAFAMNDEKAFGTGRCGQYMLIGKAKITEAKRILKVLSDSNPQPNRNYFLQPTLSQYAELFNASILLRDSCNCFARGYSYAKRDIAIDFTQFPFEIPILNNWFKIDLSQLKHLVAEKVEQNNVVLFDSHAEEKEAYWNNMESNFASMVNDAAYWIKEKQDDVHNKQYNLPLPYAWYEIAKGNNWSSKPEALLLYILSSKDSLYNGETEQLRAFLEYSNGFAKEVTPLVTWSVTPTNVGTVDKNGLFSCLKNLNQGFDIKVSCRYLNFTSIKNLNIKIAQGSMIPLTFNSFKYTPTPIDTKTDLLIPVKINDADYKLPVTLEFPSGSNVELWAPVLSRISDTERYRFYGWSAEQSYETPISDFFKNEIIVPNSKSGYAVLYKKENFVGIQYRLLNTDGTIKIIFLDNASGTGWYSEGEKVDFISNPLPGHLVYDGITYELPVPKDDANNELPRVIEIKNPLNISIDYKPVVIPTPTPPIPEPTPMICEVNVYKTPLHEFKGETGVYPLAVSRSGQYIILGNMQISISVIYDYKNNKYVSQIKNVSGTSFNSFKFTQDETKVLCGINGQPGLILYDVSTGNALRNFTIDIENAEPRSIDIANDNSNAIVGYSDGKIRLWDINTGNVKKTYNAFRGDVQSAVFSPDGKQIAAGGDEHNIKIFDINSESELYTLTGHRGIVFWVIYSNDGKFLLTGSADNTIRKWDLANRKQISWFLGHKSAIRSIDVSHDDKYLVSGSADGTAKVWDFSNAANISSLEDMGSELSAYFIPNTNYYVVTGDSSQVARIWDPFALKPPRDLTVIQKAEFLSGQTVPLMKYFVGLNWVYQDCIDYSHIVIERKGPLQDNKNIEFLQIRTVPKGISQYLDYGPNELQQKSAIEKEYEYRLKAYKNESMQSTYSDAVKGTYSFGVDPTPTPTATPIPALCLSGDLDRKNGITPRDAQLAFELYLDLIMGKIVIPPLPFETCSEYDIGDFNGDNRISPADAQLIFEKYIEQISGKKKAD